MEAKGPSVFWELGELRVPLQESLPSGATKKSAEGTLGGNLVCALPGIASRLAKRSTAHRVKIAKDFRFDAKPGKAGDIAGPRSLKIGLAGQVLNGIYPVSNHGHR